MKFTTSIVAILSVALIAFECSAAPPGGPRGEKGKNANEQRGERGKGAAGKGQGPGAQRDPAQMVARMMKEFDKDGDSKLNARELTALLTSMRERRGSGEKPGQAAGQRRAQGQKPGAAGKGQRRQGADGKKTPGGERPKRPAAE